MRRSTTIYILLLAILAGVYYYLNNREEPADIAITLEPEAVVSYLFSGEDGVPTSIRIESNSRETVEVTRDADNAWVLKLPLEASADQGSAEAAASQVSTMRILDSISDIDLAVVGLDDPEYSLTIQFTSGVERTAQIGVINPTESGYYVLDADGEVVLVARSAVDSLLNLLTNPPYLETPTPSPTATETPLPSSTPEPVTPIPATATP
jgi:hypothetical protein